MTRRQALLLLGGLVQNYVDGQNQTLSTSNVFKMPPREPVHLAIDLGQWSEWRVTLNGETVTFTAAEMFAALKESR